MKMRRLLQNLSRNTQGHAAIEFAVCGGALIAVLFGSVNVSLMGYSSMSLHNAVEAAARCRSISTVCSDAGSTQTYATSQFYNVSGQTVSFIVDVAACGNRVRGTLNYPLNWIAGSTIVPLTAAACFP